MPPEPEKSAKVEPEKAEKFEIDPEWDGKQMEVPAEDLESNEAELTEEQPVEEVEKPREFKTTIVPHTYEVKITERLNEVRTLDTEQVKASKRRIKSLEKRDENLQAKH